MSHRPECCRPDTDKCTRLIHEGIQAQCVGLKNFERHEIHAGREHTLFGLQKVIEGLLCIEKR